MFTTESDLRFLKDPTHLYTSNATNFHMYLALIAILHTIDPDCAMWVQDFNQASKWNDIDVDKPTEVEGSKQACILLLHLMADRMFFGPDIEKVLQQEEGGLDTIPGRLTFAKNNFRCISEWIQSFGSMHPVLNESQKELQKQLASHQYHDDLTYPTTCAIAMIVGRNSEHFFRRNNNNRKSPGLQINDGTIRQKITHHGSLTNNPYFSIEKCSEVLKSNNGSIDGNTPVFTSDSLKETVLHDLRPKPSTV